MKYRAAGEREKPAVRDVLCTESKRERWSVPGYGSVRHRKPRRGSQGLIDDAVPFAHLDETLHRLGIGVGVQFKGERYIGEPDGRLAVDAERSARIPPSLRDDPPPAQLDAHGGGDRADGHA